MWGVCGGRCRCVGVGQVHWIKDQTWTQLIELIPWTHTYFMMQGGHSSLSVPLQIENALNLQILDRGIVPNKLEPMDIITSSSGSLSLDTSRGSNTRVCRGGIFSLHSCFISTLVWPDTDAKLSRTLGLHVGVQWMSSYPSMKCPTFFWSAKNIHNPHTNGLYRNSHKNCMYTQCVMKYWLIANLERVAQ